MLDIPTVDLTARDGHHTAAQAAQRFGLFFVTNHGLAPEYLEALSSRAREFFERPDPHKRQVARIDGRGYVPPPDLHDPTREYKESLTLMHPHPAAAWPDDAGFCDLLRDAFALFDRLSLSLLRLLALGLAEPPEFFTAKIGASASVLRLVHYLASQHPSAAPFRCEPHTDYGTVSILLNDDAPGGLQLQTGPGVWEDIPVAPGQLLVNLGDTLESWTGGRWRAPVHRVINPPADASAASSRQSIVFFHNPDAIRSKVIDYLRT